MRASIRNALGVCLLCSALTATAWAQDSGSPPPDVQPQISQAQTSFTGARVLRHDIEVFGGTASTGKYFADEADNLDRYAYWQGDTLFFGATNPDTGNSIDGVAEFFWFESSIPKSSDFYVIVLKVKSAPNAIDSWQLSQQASWVENWVYDLDACQFVEVTMPSDGSGGAIRWDWSVPFENYKWEVTKQIQVEQGYSAGFDGSAGGTGSGQGSFSEGAYLKDLTTKADIQLKGYVNAKYSVNTQYTVTLYKWQMLVQGGAHDMAWNLVVTKNGSAVGDSAYHEYFVVIQAPEGSTVSMNGIEIAGVFRELVPLWFDGTDRMSVFVEGITFHAPDDVECYYGDTPPPGTCPDQGVCAGVVATCDNGKWNCSLPDGYEEVETTCDGLDNDCDGDVDENLTRDCQTDCGPGTETCIDGQWAGCTAPQPQPESCNDMDDDCDGLIDEELERPCTTACGEGVEYCSFGQWVGCTAPEKSDEVCDGEDNDCDGDTDEGLTRPCETPCGEGTEECVLGQWSECSAPEKSDEVCDGEDNDCDGQVDEGLQRACSTACGEGIESCEDGQWVGCTAPQPVAEACNGMDDNCDGRTDEGCDTGTTGSSGSSGAGGSGAPGGGEQRSGAGTAQPPASQPTTPPRGRAGTSSADAGDGSSLVAGQGGSGGGCAANGGGADPLVPLGVALAVAWAAARRRRRTGAAPAEVA